MLVDLVWSKDKILRAYFNIAEWGPSRIHRGGARRLQKIRRPPLRSRGRASDHDAAQSAHPRRQALNARRASPGSSTAGGAVSGDSGLHRGGEEAHSPNRHEDAARHQLAAHSTSPMATRSRRRRWHLDAILVGGARRDPHQDHRLAPAQPLTASRETNFRHFGEPRLDGGEFTDRIEPPSATASRSASRTRSSSWKDRRGSRRSAIT